MLEARERARVAFGERAGRARAARTARWSPRRYGARERAARRARRDRPAPHGLRPRDPAGGLLSRLLDGESSARERTARPAKPTDEPAEGWEALRGGGLRRDARPRAPELEEALREAEAVADARAAARPRASRARATPSARSSRRSSRSAQRELAELKEQLLAAPGRLRELPPARAAEREEALQLRPPESRQGPAARRSITWIAPSTTPARAGRGLGGHVAGRRARAAGAPRGRSPSTACPRSRPQGEPFDPALHEAMAQIEDAIGARRTRSCRCCRRAIGCGIACSDRRAWWCRSRRPAARDGRRIGLIRGRRGAPRPRGRRRARRWARSSGSISGPRTRCVAVMEGGEPQVIPNAEGARTTPSMVAFTDSGEKLVGQIAKRQAVTNPERTVFAVKRLIGRKLDTDEVQRFSQRRALRASRPPRTATPGSASADQLLLAAGDLRDGAREDAETAADFLGEPVDRRGDHGAGLLQRRAAPGDEGRRQDRRPRTCCASSTSRRPPRSPTASSRTTAKTHRGLRPRRRHLRRLDPRDRRRRLRGASSTNGDTYLGGEDFDQRIVDCLIAAVPEGDRHRPAQDTMALQRLKEAAERAKHELSSSIETDINLPFIARRRDGPEAPRTDAHARASSRRWSRDLIERLVEPCQQRARGRGAHARARSTRSILVGGMTRMPRVQREGRARSSARRRTRA